jgi:hypothetical protein
MRLHIDCCNGSDCPVHLRLESRNVALMLCACSAMTRWPAMLPADQAILRAGAKPGSIGQMHRQVCNGRRRPWR